MAYKHKRQRDDGVSMVVAYDLAASVGTLDNGGVCE